MQSFFLIYFKDVIAAHLGITPAEVSNGMIQKYATRLIIDEIREIDDEAVEITYTDVETGEQYTVRTEKVVEDNEDGCD